MNSNEARYLLVGGIAVIAYGHPRTTGDLDLWVSNEREDVERVGAVLRAFGLDLTPEFETRFLLPGKNFRIGRVPLRIELLTGISGVSFQECYERRNRSVIDGVPVDLIALDDLRRNKAASGRTKDLDDLEHLRD